MQRPEQLVLDAAFRDRIVELVERLGPVRIASAARWDGPIAQCGVESHEHAATTLVVGPLAFVLKHAANQSDEFGFVMPVAQTSRPWQRARSWRDDATLALWRAGWSTVDVDRITQATDDAVVEFAIGNARPTPQRP